MKYAVIAGTPVDTQMGVDVLVEKGYKADAFSVSKNPVEQTYFQQMNDAEKEASMKTLLTSIKTNGYDGVLVYCNSLSGAVDFPKLSQEVGIKIITPYDVYKYLAKEYRILAVISANTYGSAGIEKTIMNAQKDRYVFTYTSLKIVEAIEEGKDPEDIIKENGVDHLMKVYEAAGAEAIVLGCTHFPYVKEALKTKTTLKIIDPADEMVRLLTE